MDAEDLADIKAVAAEIRADRRRIRLGLALGTLVAAVVTVVLYYVFNELGVFDTGPRLIRRLAMPGALGMFAGGGVYSLIARRHNPFSR